MITAPGMRLVDILQSYMRNALKGKVDKEAIEIRRIWRGPGGAGVYSIKEVLEVLSDPRTDINTFKSILDLTMDDAKDEVLDMLYDKPKD